MKACTGCSVWVCEFCIRDSPACTCAFCSTNYYCPHCAELPANKGKCRKEEERQAKIAAERAKKEFREMQEAYSRRADMAAELTKEFFDLFFEEAERPEPVHGSGQADIGWTAQEQAETAEETEEPTV